MKMRIAIIDDEATVCKRLKRALEREGYEAETFLTAQPFWERMSLEPFHLVFTDLRLPDSDGLMVLDRVKKCSGDTEVIVITGYASVDTAVEAIKAGAYHYATKPLKLEEIRLLARGALEKVRLRLENRELRAALGEKGSLAEIVGNSRSMQEVFALVRKVAGVDCNVLLQGKSGTGKELIARALHNLSPRKDAPFVSFNCGGFTEELITNELFGHEKGAFTGAGATKIGLLETASRGSVFLDEIGEMPASMQVKLLHVIQERRVLRVGGIKPIDLDIRIIAATNRDLKEEVERGQFREDLYYRLNVVNIHLPPLSDRRDDVPLLVTHFIDQYSKAFGKKIKGIEHAALEILMHYDFPGNVRELKNIIERAVALSEGARILVADLPPDLRMLEFKTFQGEKLESLEEMEKQHIQRVLEKVNFNKSLAAKILDLPRTTFWRKLIKYRLQ
ncbi:MAG TPA: Fis family transcriptional regulator [Syntrophobacteraceae bacterium]|nr:Fis family transcriptional regulator [Syntrophobacteraceae bacterium]